MKNKNKKLIIGGAIFFILLAFCTTLFLFNRKKDKQSLVNNLPQLEDVNTEENTNDNTSTEEKNTENKTSDDKSTENTTSENEAVVNKTTENKESSDKKDDNKTTNKPSNNKPAGGGSSNSNQETSKPPTTPSKPTNAGLKIGEVPALLKSLGYEYMPHLIMYEIYEMREDGLRSTKASAQVIEDGEYMQLVNLKFMVNTPQMHNIIKTVLNKVVPSGASKLYNIISTNEYISTQIYKYDGKTVKIYTNGETLDIDIDYLGNNVN
ncbi:hypothetical protein [Clostridium sp.]|uniref:hypothetical protein n=1 Tax=Clostridium sp. TaxID=1506 RepID=UPI001D27C442|nr:hypothetical protein [Clostridium sp.]MBS5986672.1 hypothetical protein [Clostridium sp.]